MTPKTSLGPVGAWESRRTQKTPPYTPGIGGVDPPTPDRPENPGLDPEK